MRYYLALLILLCSVLSGNCLRRTYEVQISLISPDKRNPTPISSKTFFDADNLKTHSPLDLRIRSLTTNLIEHTVQDCQNCLYVLEFSPVAQAQDKTQKLYTSIKADLIAGKQFEDFLEVVVSENNEILSLKYGVNRYLTAGEHPNPTIIREITIGQPLESPDVVADLVAASPFNKATATAGGEAPPQPKEEQSFFKKYMWWIIIGGFILFQFLSMDKEKLMDAANQAQNPGARR